jgi:tetratricopeptide (TPR) repeat protein
VNNTRLHATLRRLSPLLIPALIPLLVAVLYGAFLNNPLVFDDQYFFLPGNPEKYVADGFQFHPRWLPYYTHGLTFTLIGDQVMWQRMGNLILHAATGLALYGLVRQLLTDLQPERDGAHGTRWVALFAALLFVLHPAAVYAAGYLIQRTIVMATLFGLLCWLSFWRGLNGSRTGLWASVLFYLLAVFSKEHAIMVPAICGVMLILHQRSRLPLAPKRPELGAAIAAQCAIALFVYLRFKGFVGNTYEPLASSMLDTLDASIPKGLAYPLSVLTQAGLFFKYLLLWILPNGTWMSIDMREPFVLPPVALQDWAFAAAFVAYPVVAGLMLWRGHTAGLIGLALLAPWLMFATEISSVRIQEIFVLYRSYLWMAPLFILVAAGLSRAPARQAAAVGLIFGAAYLAFSVNKLNTFSHSYLLWDEAAQLAEKRGADSPTTGMSRIYYNRGLALMREDFLPNAIEDFSRAISVKPEHVEAYGSRGNAHLKMKAYEAALADYNSALGLAPGVAKYHMGKAQALDGLGDFAAARNELSEACELGALQSCRILRGEQ